MIPGHFITAVGTSVGKTFVSRGLARALRRRDLRVAAIKPLETGVDAQPADAFALARACDRPELGTAPGLYRHPLPLAPYAAALETDTAPPRIADLVARVHDLASTADRLIVEGAGGLLVPLDATVTNAELARALALPLLLVARDELGVLSSVLTCIESARARDLPVTAVILSAHAPFDLARDPSPRTNRRILAERTGLPVLVFGSCPDDDAALADEAEHSGLLTLPAI
jgi:dethiobiotin synthetase